MNPRRKIVENEEYEREERPVREQEEREGNTKNERKRLQ